VGRLNGKEFENRDVKFVIGEGSEQGIVEGLEVALKKFKEGEVSVLKVKAKYAYGAAGNAQLHIPSDAELEYQVTLKSFEKVRCGFII
jgi:FKBP-type peptidyl-prolyl cis-trans isomerase